jgi:vitamin K-dependent gamma-carboxylase
MRERLLRLWEKTGAPVDAASLVAYRIAFGLLMSASAARFLANGWVDRCFVQPTFFFKYWGFGFIEVLPRDAMVAAFVALSALGLMIAVGFLYRFAAVAFFLLFTYVELIDVTNYLNHYYLVSLLALLLAIVPANATFSVDARLGLVTRSRTLPAWTLALLRFQVGLVYVFAALAKVESDWLIHAEPLQIWMSSRTDTPVLGPLLDRFDVALAMSWAGFLNDLLAVPLLSWRRTRPLAFAMIVAFHSLTGVFFNIGIFPILMPINATLFFAPDWPRRLASRLGRPERAFTPAANVAAPRALSPLLGLLLAFHCVTQVALPLRSHLYGGSVLWHEQGMRFSWRVMLRKKSGSITYRVRVPSLARELYVMPRRYLTDFQEREFAGQPDLILQLAHRIRDDYRARGFEDVEVRVDALVSLNGRPAAPMIDPDVDLAAVEDGIGRADWVLDAPSLPPARVSSRSLLSGL